MLQAKFKKYRLDFVRPSGTSKGVLTYKDSWFIKLWDSENPAIFGIGECGPLHWLSKEPLEQMDAELAKVCSNPALFIEDLKSLENIPSIRFGLEMAKMDLEQDGKRILFPSEFTQEKTSQRINGLIWMGNTKYMLQQIEDKLKKGFSCLKMKIGAIDFEKELAVLKNIRQHFSPAEIELRVDANGAFTTEEASEKLEKLAAFDLHSIEQPIAPGQWEAMHELCNKNIIDIALDEELIGVYGKQKEALIKAIQPQYLILKPSMLGGFTACDKWIELANKYNCGWWATSALESNIGLSAIAQWTFTKKNNMPQGLGTGQLYTNNFESPLYLKGEQLYFSESNNWDLSLLDL